MYPSFKYSWSRSYCWITIIHTVCPLHTCTGQCFRTVFVFVAIQVTIHLSPTPKITFSSTFYLPILRGKQLCFCLVRSRPYSCSSLLASYDTFIACFWTRYTQILNLITYIPTSTLNYYCSFIDLNLLFQRLHGLPFVHNLSRGKSSDSCRALSTLELDRWSMLREV